MPLKRLPLFDTTPHGIVVFGERVECYAFGSTIVWRRSGSPYDGSTSSHLTVLERGLRDLTDLTGQLHSLRLVRMAADTFIELYAHQLDPDYPIRLSNLWPMAARSIFASDHSDEAIRIERGLRVPGLAEPVDIEIRQGLFCRMAEFYGHDLSNELLPLAVAV